MSPLSDKLPDKCRGDSSDNKTNRFSFRWFLKRSKSSKSTREMMAPSENKRQGVAVSKSCDSGIAGMDRCSTLLLWKLLPATGKALIGASKSKQEEQRSKPFKMSFSCNDVSGIAPTTNSSAATFPAAARSSYNVASMSEQQSAKQTSSHIRSFPVKRISSVDCLNSTYRNEHLITTRPRDLPDVCQYHLCKLCLSMTPSPKMYTLEDCGCSFCIMCMHQYLFINIKEGNVAIMCPDAECSTKGEILISEIQEIVGDEIFNLFQKFKLNHEVAMDPCRTWCPTPSCETICHFSPSSIPSKGVSVYCLNCKQTFCSSCKIKWHSTKTCEEMRQILQEEEDFQLSDDEDAMIKRCPSCRVPIERDEGCAQMMCKRCKHVFCWHCLASLDDDFLLRHYDKGPCRNKLGHSRASMVWHRTQVVGIFAGFSFLLLVASPILLLAAPCLLCCRCKNCKLLNEEATLL